jgi:uncharacterized membrane protein YfcA
MEIIGYLAALVIGLSLGLIGGGGSILTVPVLVYLLGVEPVTATAYSLFIVGITSLTGVFTKYRQGNVNFTTSLIFGIPSIIAVYLTRRYIVPAIPNSLFKVYGTTIIKPVFLMSFFGLLMVAAAIVMLNKTPVSENSREKQSLNYPLIFLVGIIEGTITGMVGAGGGFLIIPALVLLCKLPMKQAIGTSLLIIACKSLLGFTGDLGHTYINWPLILIISGLAITGIFIGNRLSNRVNSENLKKGFSWFVLIMGIYIIIKEMLDTFQIH